jgi:hypothetical protein
MCPVLITEMTGMAYPSINEAHMIRSPEAKLYRACVASQEDHQDPDFSDFLS